MQLVSSGGTPLQGFPTQKKPEDSPKATPIPSRGVSPVIPYPPQGSSPAAQAPPQKFGTKGLGSSSLPMTRAHAIAEAAHALGIILNPTSIFLDSSSSMVVSNAQFTMAHCNVSTPPPSSLLYHLPFHSHLPPPHSLPWGNLPPIHIFSVLAPTPWICQDTR